MQNSKVSLFLSVTQLQVSGNFIFYLLHISVYLIYSHLYSKTIFDTYGHYVRFWCIGAYGAILCYRDCSFETFYQVYYDIYVTEYILQSEKKSINKQTHILPWSMHVFFELISSRTCVRSLVSRAICIGLY